MADGASSVDDIAEPFLGVKQSLGGRRWMLRPASERLAQALAQRHGLPDIAGRVLASRGVELDAATDFLNPTLRAYLPDPSCLKDMDKAAVHLADAMQGGKRIAVFGDYDVDGATSSAVLALFFRALGTALVTYIPDRMAEGYGPNTPALLKLKDEGIDLVVTVDCGTLSYEPLAAARKAGLEVIVIDHHKAEPLLPEAVAVVNPNRLDEDGSLGQLAAVGVTFLLVVALNRVLRDRGYYTDSRPAPDLLALLDLVALGTVCDVVPLTGPNRAFVAQGLKVMAGRGNVGLTALADVAGMDSAPGVYHLGFLLGPRVNAGGRVGQSDLGVRLLTSQDRDEALTLARQLDAFNQDRRQIEAEVLDAALAMPGLGDDPVTIVAGEGWHPGVIGIVASRLKDRTNRPTVVFALDGNEAKGSARSISGVDIGAAVIEAVHQGHLMGGGGHAMAAGMTVSRDQLDGFRTYMNKSLATSVAQAISGMTLALDGVLAVRGVQPALVDALDAGGPYGMGHPAPRLAVTDAQIVKADVVGTDHVRLMVAGGDGGRLKVMAFRQADQPLGRALLGGVGQRFHLAGRLKKDDWGAVERAELHLEDAAPA